MLDLKLSGIFELMYFVYKYGCLIIFISFRKMFLSLN